MEQRKNGDPLGVAAFESAIEGSKEVPTTKDLVANHCN
jgi:hypothetical protein